MGMGRVVIWAAAAAALVVLPACGKRFPFGERLLPESYGPPFGSALKDVIPAHPHNPADAERHAASDAEENRRYASHAACNAAMRARFAGHAAAPDASGHGTPAAAAPVHHGGEAAEARHGSGPAPDPHGPVQISSIESVGHYTAGDIVHEYRCTDHVLSYRAWHREEPGHAGGQQSH